MSEAMGKIDAVTAEKSLYVMVSQTHTRIGKLLRRAGGLTYNHAAISLDAELKQLYAFARVQRNTALLGGLVSESIFRYTLGKPGRVQVMIFKINVTEEQYRWVEAAIREIRNDKEYLYNLISVITYPVFGGLETYKAFSCAEFVMYLLHGIGFPLSKPLPAYRPDDLPEILRDYRFFEGNLPDYTSAGGKDDAYLAPLNGGLVKRGFYMAKELIRRTFSSHRA